MIIDLIDWMVMTAANSQVITIHSLTHSYIILFSRILTSLVHLWMAPIFQRIATCEDLQHLNKLRELLKATVLGLMTNPSVQSTTLMAYVLTLLQDGEKQLEQEKKEKKEMANEAAVWVTDAITERVTSDGRAQLMVEEAVKLSGTNRNASQRKRVNTNTKEELMGFAIQVG